MCQHSKVHTFKNHNACTETQKGIKKKLAEKSKTKLVISTLCHVSSVCVCIWGEGEWVCLCAFLYIDGGNANVKFIYLFYIN